jgi:hypothetical protein
MSASLSQKIADAKGRLPLPDLMKRLGVGEHAVKSCQSPFRDDKNASWGIFNGDKGWKWKDHGTGETGDEIDFIAQVESLSPDDARKRYFELAGLREEAAPVARNGNSVPGHAVDKAKAREPEPPFDWITCCNNLSDDQAQGIAKWRGLSTDLMMALRDYRLLGVFTPWPQGSTPCVAFLVTGENGAIIGCHYRLNAESAQAMTAASPNGRSYEEGSWMYSKGASVRPLIIGDPSTAADCLIFESQWDAIAVAQALGWHEGRCERTAFIITRGSQNAKTIDPALNLDCRAIAVPQNDKPRKGEKITPAAKWLVDVREALSDHDILTVTVPAEHKDANDWLKTGIPDTDVILAIANAQRPPSAVIRRSLADYADLTIDTSDTLLGDRYICRGSVLLFVAPSGVGKSSCSAQKDALWANGREAFGIKPAKPLRILTVQVENDEGDLIEMAQGVIKGLDLTEEQIGMVRENTRIVTISGRMGDAFVAKLRTEMRRFRPDIVRIDPITGFFKGDVRDSALVNEFCREKLQPLWDEFKCACILVAHTPKTSNRDTSKWTESDWMYAAAGSADWTNYARAVLIVDPAKYPIFKFIATKRKGRIGWIDVVGNKESERFFKHNDDRDGLMYWREATITEQTKAAEAGKTKYTLLELVPHDKTPIEKNALFSKASTANIGKHKSGNFLAELIHDKLVSELLVPRPNARPAIHIVRV